jgi:pimeloyl-ACP methyl ester carboxylesterase
MTDWSVIRRGGALKSRIVGVVAVALAALIWGYIAPAGAAPPNYPVPNSYFAGLQAQVARPGQAPPGSNDWSCRPTSEHPEPVILLHGFVSTSALTWQTLSPSLANQGYCVFALDYGVIGGVGGLAPVERSAAQLGQFVRRVLGATGARQVDLVGHSEGATMPFYYLGHEPGAARTVHRYVSLAALNAGTTQSGLSPLIAAAFAVPGLGTELGKWCGPCHQLLAGSRFLNDLKPDGARYPAIDFTNIVTQFDQIATPYPTGLLTGPNVANIVVQQRCSRDYTDHLELPSDPVTARIVLNALDPAHQSAPRCEFVAPMVGPLPPRVG